MKQIFRKLKYGGYSGAKNRLQMRFMMFGLIALGAITLMLLLTGGMGCVAGVCTAGVFAIPVGLDLTEKEQKGLKALAEHFNEQFQNFSKGQMSEEEMLNKMNTKLKEWSELNGISKEKFEQMSETLRKQGEALTALKEQSLTNSRRTGLRAAFEKGYDDLVAAVKGQKANVVIKAVSEHTDGKIHTTTTSISTTTSAQLSDSVEHSTELFVKRQGKQYIHDIADVTVVNEVPEIFVYDEEGAEDGSFAVVAENGLKPQVNLKLIRNQVTAKKAAGYIVVTEEMMKWRDILWSHIQRLFRGKLERDYEEKLTADLLTNAVAYTSTGLDTSIANPTEFDAIAAAVLQLENLNFAPDVLVINPTDKWKLALTQANNGTFILPYIQNGGQFALLGLRVITSTKVTAGEFIIGESGTWYIQEETPRLRTGLVNDDFIHNRMTIIGEVFFLSYIPTNNKGSFVKGNFATIKEALKTA